MRNYWEEYAELRSAAYLRGEISLTHAVVNIALQLHITPARYGSRPPLRILDVGGGQAIQGRALAKAGHNVTVLDPDELMLAAAEAALSNEDADVRERVTLLHGNGEHAVDLAGTQFDLVCCHSVLIYLQDPMPLVEALVNCTKPRGLLSIVSVNSEAIAMRSGLQGKWTDTIKSLLSGRQEGASYLPVRETPLRAVRDWFESRGVQMLTWYGVGVFTDHYTAPIQCDDLSSVVKVEWLAGERDPYRSVARCFHLLMRRPEDSSDHNRDSALDRRQA